jgi:large subunit ribosomal protein L35
MRRNKLKSHKGFCKRFSITKNGSIKFNSSKRRHGLSNKSRKHNRQLKNAKFLTNSSRKIIKQQICYL